MKTCEKIFNPPIKKNMTRHSRQRKYRRSAAGKVVCPDGQSFILRSFDRYCGVTSR